MWKLEKGFPLYLASGTSTSTAPAVVLSRPGQYPAPNRRTPIATHLPPPLPPLASTDQVSRLRWLKHIEFWTGTQTNQFLFC